MSRNSFSSLESCKSECEESVKSVRKSKHIIFSVLNVCKAILKTKYFDYVKGVIFQWIRVNARLILLDITTTSIKKNVLNLFMVKQKLTIGIIGISRLEYKF